MHPLRCVGIYFIKSKSICADPQDSSPRNLTLCGRRRATGKGKGCVLSSAKINLLFRTTVIFYEKTFSFFNLANKWTKTRGLFFDPSPVSLIAPPLSQGAFLLWGEIGSCFLAPFGVRSVSGPSGQCALAHGDAHPRLAHSASFTFLPSPITCNLLNYGSLGVKALYFHYLFRRVKDLHRNLHPQNTVAQQFAPIG